jgi:hypothetical protein
MKSICKVLLPAAIGLAFIGAAAAPQTGPAYGPRPIGGGVYVDPSNGFSMGVPAFTGRNAERSVVVWFQAPPQDGFASNVNVLIDPVKTTRAAYVQDFILALQRSNPQADKRSMKELKISGRDAEILEYDASMGGRRLRFLQLLVVDDEAAYVVTCTSPAATFPTYETEFHKCLDSFHLLRARQD